jgi:DnaK suppressor protein
MKRTDFIKKMQQRLIVRRDALRSVLAGDVNTLRSIRDSAVGDEGDVSVFGEQAEISSQMAQVESRELTKVERALEQMREGSYGKCESCNKAINVLRLQAVPYATECIHCARKGERERAREEGRSHYDRMATTDDDHEVTLDEAESEIA